MKPRVTTRRTRAAEYRRIVLANSAYNKQSERIIALLKSLPESPEPDDVIKAHAEAWGGSYNPTVAECDACGQVHDVLVTVGQEFDYDSRTAELCIGCLREALAALEAAQ